MGLSYLLARASDTIADANEAVADPRERIRLLDQLGETVEGRNDPEFFAAAGRMLGESHGHGGERQLMNRLPDCMDWLEEVSDEARKLIRDVLRLIFRGQRLDLERFEVPAKKPQALSTPDELDEYTYLVAGSVGEFWTAMCGLLLARPFAREAGEMRTLSIEFGKGLQLLNIIRDYPKDLAQGRCYFPVGDAVREKGGEELMPEVRTLLAKCRERLEAGRAYVAATRPVRLRFAAALPLAIAFRTWSGLQGADWETMKRGVKITRPEVKGLMRSLAWRSLRPSWTSGFLDSLAP